MNRPRTTFKSFLILGGLLVVFSGLARELPVVTPEKAGMSATKLARVDEIVIGLVGQKRLAGATVIVARRGSVVYFKTFGEMDGASGEAMRKDAIFRIYSMTKAVTSVGVMMLVDDGKIGLDDPVAKHLPEFAGVRVWTEAGGVVPKRPPTVRDLLRHTAGLTYGAFGNSPVDQLYRQAHVLDPNTELAAMSVKVAKLPLQYEPGTQWLYSVSVDILGRVIEAASGQSLDVFLQKRIFDPLDLRDTAFHVPAAKLNRLATVHSSDGKGTLTTVASPPGSSPGVAPKFLSGGGGLYSTARDYLRFLQMIANGGELHDVRLLRAGTVVDMTRNQLSSAAMPIAFGAEKREGVGFGLGFNVRVAASDWDPAGRIGEYGWGGLASTHYWVSPKDDLVVVTMEQTLPYSFQLEWAIKGPIYDAIME